MNTLQLGFDRTSRTIRTNEVEWTFDTDEKFNTALDHLFAKTKDIFDDYDVPLDIMNDRLSEIDLSQFK